MSTWAMIAAAAGTALALGSGAGYAVGGRRRRGLVRALDETMADLAEARTEAWTDELTRLPNRRALLQELLWRTEGVPSEAPFAVLMVDLDGFKEINDGLGHAAGDEVLVALAERLQEQADLTIEGFAARLGGDEFVLVTELPAADFTLSLARAVAEVVAEPIDVDGELVHVRASVGAVQGGLGDDVSALLRGADVAMFEAKAGYGVDGVAEFDPAREVTELGERPPVRLREVARRARIEGRDWAATRFGVIA